MIIILFGSPGSGKGTQSLFLREKYGVVHLSTGEILRQVKKSGTPLGRQLAPILDRGDLVGDDLMIKILNERISQPDCRSGFLLDGFPRTVVQAEYLERLFRETARKITAVIELRVSPEIVLERISKRYLAAAEPRPEDNPEAIRHRIAVFEEETQPLAKFYRDRDLLLSVDGTGSPEEVFERIERGLESCSNT